MPAILVLYQNLCLSAISVQSAYPSVVALVELLFSLLLLVQQTTRRGLVILTGGSDDMRHVPPVSTETVELVSLNSLQAPSAHSATNRRPHPPPLDGGGTRTRKGATDAKLRVLSVPQLGEVAQCASCADDAE